MVLQTRLFVIALSLAVLIFVLNLVRTRKIKEQFALLWVLLAVILCVIPLSIDLLDAFAFAIGVDYPPGLLFLIAFIGILFILVQFSMSISQMTDQIKNIAQDLALLNKRVENIEQRLDRPENPTEEDQA